MLHNDQFAFVIPAYNEELAIASVISKTKPHGLTIVVDDGSIDSTSQIAENLGAIVVRHIKNNGYDNSLQTGLRKAIECGCMYAITIDADGQHNSVDLQEFKLALIEGADVVVGARDKFQRISEHIFAWISTKMWGVEDPLCGIKGYKVSNLIEFGHFDTYNSIGTEFTLRCARSGLVVRSIKIETRDRAGSSKFGMGIKSNLKILKAMALGMVYAGTFAPKYIEKNKKLPKI